VVAAPAAVVPAAPSAVVALAPASSSSSPPHAASDSPIATDASIDQVRRPRREFDRTS
jgi:hypothetical protein